MSNEIDDNDHYIVELNIDEDSLPVSSQEMLHERRVAVFDLLEDNFFRPLDSENGPYILAVSLEDGSRLVLEISRRDESQKNTI